MFETILTLCLAASPDICRDVMFPAERCPAAIAVPETLTAKGPPRCVAPGAQAALTEVSAGVFVHSGAVADAGPEHGGDLSNAGVVIGTEAIAVFDTGGSREAGEALFRAIRAQSDLPIRYVVLSHMHPDHIFGASVFAEAGAEVIGHPSLARALADRAAAYSENYGTRLGARFVGSEIPKVDRAVSDAMVLDLGGRSLLLQVWPLAHSATDVTALDLQSGVLFAGDLIFNRHVPALDGSLRGWERALHEVTALGATHVVPGHGAPLLPVEDAILPMHRYLGLLAADTRTEIDRGTSLGQAITQIGVGEANNWELFDLFNPRNATVAFSELEWE